jgi:hypothetical protein
MTIDKFIGSHSWLSNFYPHPVEFEGMEYPTVEHAYQAAKTLDEAQRAKVRQAATPGKAKALGKRVTLRHGWNDMRLAVMRAILEVKFANPTLRAKLIATGQDELIEGNTWNDRFWGVCRGAGQNHLGKLLMAIREEM